MNGKLFPNWLECWRLTPPKTVSPSFGAVVSLDSGIQVLEACLSGSVRWGVFGRLQFLPNVGGTVIPYLNIIVPQKIRQVRFLRYNSAEKEKVGCPRGRGGLKKNTYRRNKTPNE